VKEYRSGARSKRTEVQLEAQPLRELADQAGVEFAALFAAREKTTRELEERRERLDALVRSDDVAVVLLGSWGRTELTSASDDDYMVLVHGPWRPEHEVDPTIEDVAEVFGSTPGREGVFGNVVFSDFLFKRIGLQEDDNNNLTRRMLLLLESRVAAGQDPYEAARNAILNGYLAETPTGNRPPRFLLNDIVRYWRTICVDFTGKQRKRRGDGWGLRNAKLRTSRKLLFAGGLVPALRCIEFESNGIAEFLDGQFRVPPSDRLADAFLRYGKIDVGARALSAYDRFIELLNDTHFREALDSLPKAGASESEEFQTVRSLGHQFEESLIDLLFGTELRPWAQRYGMF
jgi:hypothetical protein